MPSYRLGAEELVELGRGPGGAHVSGRTPFFTSRPRLGAASPGPGVAPREVSGFIEKNLQVALDTMGDLAGVSPVVMAQGQDITFGVVSGLLEKVPALGSLFAQILVLGGAAVQLGLPFQGLENILAGIGKALRANGPSAQNDAKISEVRDGLLNKVQGPQRDAVQRLLGASASNTGVLFR